MREAAEKALAAGDLAGARTALVAAIRAAPGDPSLRSFLFQLACVTGDWTRATQALETLGTLDSQTLDMVADYRAAIAAEETRAAVFAGRARPDVFGEHAWTGLLADALAMDAAGDAAGAEAARKSAFEAAPASPGRIDDTAFDWIADADNRLGPVIEAVMNGAYRWLPVAELEELEITAPRDLRDVVWAVGIVTFRGGAQWPVLLPARYPGSEAAEDPAIALGRRTEWREIGTDLYAGLGQRVLATPAADVALLDARRLTLYPTDRAPTDTATAP